MIGYTHMLSFLLMISFLENNSLQKIFWEGDVVREAGLISNQGGCCLLTGTKAAAAATLRSLVSLHNGKEMKCYLLTSASHCSWRGCSKGRGIVRATVCPSGSLQSVNKDFQGWTWGFLCASYYGCRRTRPLLGSCWQKATTWTGVSATCLHLISANTS